MKFAFLKLLFGVLCWFTAVNASAATMAFSPSSATPGQSVTIRGNAQPNSYMSFYLWQGKWVHMGVAKVNGRGQYQHGIVIPVNQLPGSTTLTGGCDRPCGNGWMQARLAVTPPSGSATPGNLGARAGANELVVNSYLVAFGRRPSNDELNYWMSQPANAPMLATVESLAAAHLGWLKTAPAEQRETARRALGEAFKGAAWWDQEALIKNAVVDMMAGREGGGYRGLLTYLRQPEVNRYYANLAGNVADAQRAQQEAQRAQQEAQRAQQEAQRRAEAERARTTWAAKFLNKRGKPERCFGGIGPGCDGAPLAGTQAQSNGTTRAHVAVGSILHDNCCVRNPDGFMCGGNQNNIADPGQLVGMNDGLACAKEWRKAVYNTRDNRKWLFDFGPYADADLSERYGDDITPTGGRQTRMSDGAGRFNYIYDGGETPSSRRLCAPAGVNLDKDDVQFCCSGQFSRQWAAPGVGDWGVCR
ncbi:MAG: hypothetical protein A3F78_11235 [Burkholderiales bacterium RIFCSPLOWO2_12_FULL_61_40]|nr:MAG: hypothetical protein A3F78_11235 [Burkholderiales bacterium RIFCSPLOWO2_12_FULL_61_40]